MFDSESIKTFLAHARETYAAPLPRYVEQEFRGYLRCGVFAHGFVHCRCESCGHDLLVAWSCKGRGVCPSCTGRRMANVAAHLVDRVLPALPVRQWVLSLPFELHLAAAFRADVLSALGRIFVEAVFARHRAWAKERGPGKVAAGAITHVQRFGSSINLNVHFHTTVLDGVFTRDEHGRPLFHPTPPPTRDELGAVVRRVHRRAVAWLRRRGYLSASAGEPGSQELPLQTALEACARVALQRGATRTTRDHAGDDHVAETLVQASPLEEEAVEVGGFNLHASVAIAADDDFGRERLMRYGARPPLALDRLQLLAAGLVGYRIKKLRGGRAKMRMMTPLEFLARLAAIVPPPRFPLLRYHGVLAPRSSWRRDVVPCAPSAALCPGSHPKREWSTGPQQHGPIGTPATPQQRPRESVSRSGETSAGASSPSNRKSVPAEAMFLSPNILSVRHWNRLLGGVLFAATPRVDWATLLRRSFDVDVLRCTSCGGRLRVLGDVLEPAVVRLVLEALGLPADPPPVARARDPTEVAHPTLFP
jgi:hypothetical protein